MSDEQLQTYAKQFVSDGYIRRQSARNAFYYFYDSPNEILRLPCDLRVAVEKTLTELEVDFFSSDF